jgi:N-acetylmuramoyl-L-alanine amidase
MLRVLTLLCLMLPLASEAAGLRVEGIRTWAGPDHTRVVFDLSRAGEHTLFTLTNPHRVVIDLEQATLEPGLIREAEATGVVKRIRSGRREGGVLRVVLDLDRAVNPRSFVVPPNETYGHRLVVDLEKPRAANEPLKTLPVGSDDLLIAIDAGHGGEDPGAIGANGTYEKDVVLSVSRKLAELIEREPGMEPLLIRDGDYYVGLRERTAIARKARADLFVSVHADAFTDRSVRGSSVYVLSESGASSEAARLLAASENRADRIGGVSLEDKDDVVASVLVDLSRVATAEASNELAATLLDEFRAVGEVHGNRVERAGFAVLKSLDMPSVLVELAFISNPVEEQRLRDADHQWQLARALHAGIVEYADEHLRNRGAPGEYIVRRGDTLSGIARRHSISVDRLREVNEISGDTILVGSRLLIP